MLLIVDDCDTFFSFTRKLVNNFALILSDVIFECCFLILVVGTNKTNPIVWNIQEYLEN